LEIRITEGNELQKLTECDKNVIIYSATETEEIFFKEDSNGNYNPQNEMYQFLKRNVHFLSGG